MLNEIAQHIEDNTALELGSTLQVGFRPATAPDRCVVLLERTPGKADFYLADRIDYHLQVIARSPDLQEARSDAWAVHALLHGKAGIDLPQVNSGPRYHASTIEANQAPGWIGQDERGRHEYSVNFTFKIQTP